MSGALIGYTAVIKYEFGIAARDDAEAERLLDEHVQQLERAVEDGEVVVEIVEPSFRDLGEISWAEARKKCLVLPDAEPLTPSARPRRDGRPSTSRPSAGRAGPGGREPPWSRI